MATWDTAQSEGPSALERASMFENPAGKSKDSAGSAPVRRGFTTFGGSMKRKPGASSSATGTAGSHSSSSGSGMSNAAPQAGPLRKSATTPSSSEHAPASNGVGGPARASTGHHTGGSSGGGFSVQPRVAGAGSSSTATASRPSGFSTVAARRDTSGTKPSATTNRGGFSTFATAFKNASSASTQDTAANGPLPVKHQAASSSQAAHVHNSSSASSLATSSASTVTNSVHQPAPVSSSTTATRTSGLASFGKAAPAGSATNSSATTHGSSHTTSAVSHAKTETSARSVTSSSSASTTTSSSVSTSQNQAVDRSTVRAATFAASARFSASKPPSAGPARTENKSSQPAPRAKSVSTQNKTAFTPSGIDRCAVCSKAVYAMEKLNADGYVYHKTCFRCEECNKTVKLGTYAAIDGRIFCKPHFAQLFKLKGNYNEGFGTELHRYKWVKDSHSEEAEA